MERERRALDVFVQLHAQKLRNHKYTERVAFLVQFSESIPLDVKFTPFTVSKVQECLDSSNPTVQWLLKQMHTYEPSTSNIVGLIFEKSIVLAHVVSFGESKSDDD